MSEPGFCEGCSKHRDEVREGLCPSCWRLIYPEAPSPFPALDERGTSDAMPTAPNDPRLAAEAAIASLHALALADVSLAAYAAEQIATIRAKYPADDAGPSSPPI